MRRDDERGVVDTPDTVRETQAERIDYENTPLGVYDRPARGVTNWLGIVLLIILVLVAVSVFALLI